MRLFVAIDLPEASKRAMKALIDASRPRAPRARWADVGTSHVTLAFLGEVEEERLAGVRDAVTEAARRHERVALRFGAPGTFGGSRARVLWVGFDAGTAQERLASLRADLVARLRVLGLPLEDEPLVLHLTLARARDPRGDRGLRELATSLDGTSLGTIDVREIVLYRSVLGRSAPVHTPLLRAPLAPPAGARAPDIPYE